MSVAAQRNEWETRSVALDEARSTVEGKRIHGYGVVFRSLSQDFGGFREMILPEAVDRTLREGRNVMSYFNHDPSRVLGKLHAGTLALKKDARGLRFEIDPDTRQVWVKDLMRSIERGDVNGASFRFRVMPGGDSFESRDGQIVRIIRDMVIREIGPVSEPAYDATDTAVRSYQEYLEVCGHRPSLSWRERKVRAGRV